MEQIEVKDGRGAHFAETRKKNVELVWEFFTRNPGATQKQCAETVGLTPPTVRSILNKELAP